MIDHFLLKPAGILLVNNQHRLILGATLGSLRGVRSEQRRERDLVISHEAVECFPSRSRAHRFGKAI
jgi:hypothetical protein